MRLARFITTIATFVALVTLVMLGTLSQPAAAKGLYSQIVLTLGTPRPLQHDYDKAANALIIAFQKTAPSELSALDHYDERLIKRVIVKDLGPAGTEVKLVLRDRKVRAMVHQFQEPFRVAIDIFDVDFAEDRDPVTGLPHVAANTNKGGPSDGSFALLATEDGSSDNTATPFSTNNGDVSDASSQRRLLQPLPELFVSPEEMASTLNQVADGIGKAWADYPPYIYRLQTAAYEAGMDNRKTPSPAQALTSAQAMADYAGKLFNLGHENRALIAYQQVLHKEPAVFDHDALHLWKFAEIHLGQGNMTLARGYLQALVEKHPASPLAQFAKLRMLDIAAIRMIKQERQSETDGLLPRLTEVTPRHVGELMALTSLRRAYWSKPANTSVGKVLPDVTGDLRNELATAYPQVESPKTAFLVASIILQDMTRADTGWQRGTAQFADAYFKRFSGDAAQPYRDDLRRALYTKLNKNLQAKATDGKLIEAIDDYEALPTSMQSVKKEGKTAWALGEAYRKLGQPAKAVDFYVVAAKNTAEGPDRFKAQFWLATTAGEAAESLRAAKGSEAKISSLRSTSRDADRAADATWRRLPDPERKALSVAYKDHFEKGVQSLARLRTPPKIVLSMWSDALGTRATTQTASASSTDNDWQRNFSPSGSAVILLSDLGKRFAELGMADERRQAISLLKTMKPSEFEDDKAAKDIWSKQLIQLADDYREANQYLDAGRLYSLVGTESENWAGRAEALYKGGLLLFRAGRREEAMAAFTQASNDGNNLFYANLAKERLSQLE